MSQSVVMIPGAFCGPWCFADFVPAFSARGFACHTPDLRFHASGPEAPPDPRLAGVSIADYAADIARLNEGLPDEPILVGHSMGGLIAQKLASQGLARALILLAPGAPWGILPSTNDERKLAMGLMQAAPFWDKALSASFKIACTDSLASLSPEEQRRVFAKFSAESGRALFELFFWMFDADRMTSVDAHKVRCPVLVVSGSDDKVISAETGRKVAKLYPLGEFYEARGRGHFLLMEEGAGALASSCAAWACETLSKEAVCA